MTKEEKAALVAECRASGLTAKEWCRQKGIKYSQYCSWASRINRKVRQNQEQQWADVTMVREDTKSDDIRIQCGKLTIYVQLGFNQSLLLDVLKVVQALC